MRAFGRRGFSVVKDLWEMISYGDKGLVLGVCVMSCHWCVRSLSCWDLFLLLEVWVLVGLLVMGLGLCEGSASVSSVSVASSWSLQLIKREMRW
jgi:hypothetical protein